MPDFTHLKEGDTVTRMLGGTVPMLMKVTRVEDIVVACTAYSEDGEREVDAEWTFDRRTGVEEDPYLRWGVAFGQTGSVLVPNE